MDRSSSRASEAPAAGAAPQFPAGLRVLVVDDDPICLKILEAMLRRCLYEVTTCSRAIVALSMLRERKGAFDVVLSDVYMPDMDGFKLLEHIGLEMDLPVIMMSADDGKDVVMKGVTHGACDYLIKPVRIEALKTIWQHVVRKKRNELREIENSGSLDESDKQKRALDDDDNVSSANEGSWKNVKKRKEGKEDEDESEGREDSSTLKKPRVVWSVELHQQFVTAVNQLGVEKAVPKKILELMNTPGLTRENVASHLQKYRLYLRRVSLPQHQGRFDMPFISATDGVFGSSSLDGFDLQALAVTGQLPPQNLVSMHAGPKRVANSATGMPAIDQISFFNSDTHIANSSRIRSSPGQLWNNKQMNLLCGTPTGIDSTRLGQPQQPVQSYGNMGLQVIEGKPGFVNLSSSLRTSSSFPRGSIGGNLDNSNIMQMSQQGQQFSVSQQQNHVPNDLPHRSQLRGQLLNGLQGEQNLMFSPTMGKQLLSNEISGHISGKGGAPENGNTSLAGTYTSTSVYGAVPQAPFVEFPNSSFTESTGGCFSLASSMGTSSNISTGMFQESQRATGSTDASSNMINLKGVKNYVPNYNLFGELHQTNSPDWRIQNVNFPYESTHIGSKQNNINFNFGSSNSVHQDLSATLRDGSRQTCNVAKENISVRTEVEYKVGSSAQQNNTYLFENSVRVKTETMADPHHQDVQFDDNIIPNELMSVIGTQHHGVIGQGEAESNFDGYYLDDISV